MEINNIEKCKACISINYDLKCDSSNTTYADPNLNFPCRYYVDREDFFKEYSNYFEARTNKED